MLSRREQRHSSIILKQGKPIAFGFNSDGFHAEEEALNKQWFGYNFKNHVMINIRLTPGNKIGNSKPCPACLELLKFKKLRKVIYSTNEGTFEEIIL
jgi:pyrimidine deaminase RibD-like protein